MLLLSLMFTLVTDDDDDDDDNNDDDDDDDDDDDYYFVLYIFQSCEEYLKAIEYGFVILAITNQTEITPHSSGVPRNFLSFSTAV